MCHDVDVKYSSRKTHIHETKLSRSILAGAFESLVFCQKLLCYISMVTIGTENDYDDIHDVDACLMARQRWGVLIRAFDL